MWFYLRPYTWCRVSPIKEVLMCTEFSILASASGFLAQRFLIPAFA